MVILQPEVKFIPSGVCVRVRPGTSLLDAARRARIPIATRCGGNASCLMCKVKVREQRGLSLPRSNEERKLGTLIGQGFRLSCQAKVIGNVTVEVQEDPLKAAVRRQLAQLDGEL